MTKRDQVILFQLNSTTVAVATAATTITTKIRTTAFLACLSTNLTARHATLPAAVKTPRHCRKAFRQAEDHRIAGLIEEIYAVSG